VSLSPRKACGLGFSDLVVKQQLSTPLSSRTPGPIPRDVRNGRAASPAHNNQILWLWVPGRRPPALSRHRACPGRHLRMLSSATVHLGLCGICLRAFVLAARFASELSGRPPSFKSEGAGKAGCWSHPRSACNKKHAAEPQVRAETTGLPCANGLRLIRALPGDRRSCPHRPRAQRALRTWPQHREARTTRLRRPYRVVRPLA
jgi:hypothetical protein